MCSVRKYRFDLGYLRNKREILRDTKTKLVGFTATAASQKSPKACGRQANC
jgi:hypothetical protein